MIELWAQLHDLFDTDDGSLPDLIVENLSSAQVVTIYQWVRSLCDVYTDDGEPTLWHCEQERDVPITSLDSPAQLIISGRAKSFRHGLAELSISGIVIPQLTVAVSPNKIEFDYRMGLEWGPSELDALFDFLWSVQQLAPAATISHSYEGDSKPTQIFARLWDEFKLGKSAT